MAHVDRPDRQIGARMMRSATRSRQRVSRWRRQIEAQEIDASEYRNHIMPWIELIGVAVIGYAIVAA